MEQKAGLFFGLLTSLGYLGFVYYMKQAEKSMCPTPVKSVTLTIDLSIYTPLSGRYLSGRYHSGRYHSGRYRSGRSRSGRSRSGRPRSGRYGSGRYGSGPSRSGRYRSGPSRSGRYMA